MGKHEKPGIAWVIEKSWWGDYGRDWKPDLDHGIFLDKERAEEEAVRLNEKERKLYETRKFNKADMNEYYVEEYDLHG